MIKVGIGVGGIGTVLAVAAMGASAQAPPTAGSSRLAQARTARRHSVSSSGPAHAARTSVVGALLYRNLDRGTVDAVFRTSAPLPLTGASAGGGPRIPARIAGQSADSFTITAARRCYDVNVTLDVDGKLGGRRVRIGQRLPVELGAGGALYRASLPLLPSRYDYPRGLSIGCADPNTDTVIVGTTGLGQVKPRQWFFTADAGPYLTNLRWSGWGTHRAVARGTYVATCGESLCGPRLITRARFILTGLERCAAQGAMTYRHWRLEKRIAGRWKSENIPAVC